MLTEKDLHSKVSRRPFGAIRTPGATNSAQDDRGLRHTPVMVAEVLDFLCCTPGGIYLDATVGLGGHAEAILERIQPGGLLIGMDRDQESLEKARVRLNAYAQSIRLLHENFKNLPLVLNNLPIKTVDGILVDLGVSSHQLLTPERGFSFQSDGPLDMRMDRSQGLTAASMVNDLPEKLLADIIHRYGEEPYARRIAAAIVFARNHASIVRSAQLADIVARAVRGRRNAKIHPATRTFQALRIAVNQELEGLEEFLLQGINFLNPGGRLVVISFHSLEDRIVKTTFRWLSGYCVCDRPPELCVCPRQAVARLLSRRAVKPSADEVLANPRARSARLRSVEKT